MKLNDCPLCHSQYVGTYYLDGRFFVACQDCDIRTQSYDSEEEAQLAWNKLSSKHTPRVEPNWEIQFHKIHSGVVLPESHNGVCFDLTIPEGVTFNGELLEHKLISLGFSAKLPEGYHAKVYLRSSSPKKYGIILANSVGIIDSSYCGDNDEWKLSVLHYRGRREGIPAGTRLAQFELVRNNPVPRFLIVDSLNGPDRGGFGSTGV